MNKLFKRILTGTIVGAMILSTSIVSASAAESDVWNTHYHKYDSHTIDDVYVTYCGSGFKAKITARSGGYSNSVTIRSVKSDGNTSLLYSNINVVGSEVIIEGDWVQPVAGDTHFTVTLEYQSSNSNETIINNGIIRMNIN